MKGLLVKDLLILKRSAKNILAVVIIFIFSGWLDQSSGMMLAIAFVLSMNVLTSFSYDQFSDWETYAFTMPISRRDYVTSKFVLGGILSVSGTVLVAIFLSLKMIITGTFDGEFLVISIVTSLFGSYLLSSLSLPLLFKLPIEKARMAIMGTVATIFVGGMLLNSLTKQLNWQLLAGLNNLSGAQLILGIISTSLLLIIFSFGLSNKILNKKYQ